MTQKKQNKDAKDKGNVLHEESLEENQDRGCTGTFGCGRHSAQL